MGVWFNFEFVYSNASGHLGARGFDDCVGALIHLPIRVIAGFGLLMIALHNLVDRFEVPGGMGPNSGADVRAKDLDTSSSVALQSISDPRRSKPGVVVIYSLIRGWCDGGWLCFRRFIHEGRAAKRRRGY